MTYFIATKDELLVMLILNVLRINKHWNWAISVLFTVDPIETILSAILVVVLVIRQVRCSECKHFREKVVRQKECAHAGSDGHA